MARKKIKFDITELSLLYDNLLVEPVDTIKDIDDPVYDPKQYSDKPEVGIVRAVGSGRIVEMDGSLIPLRESIGDIVLFNKYSSQKYRNPATSEDLIIVREEDIVGYKKGTP